MGRRGDRGIHFKSVVFVTKCREGGGAEEGGDESLCVPQTRSNHPRLLDKRCLALLPGQRYFRVNQTDRATETSVEECNNSCSRGRKRENLIGRRRRSGIQRLTASSKRLQVLIDRKSLTSTTGKERKYPEEFIRYFFQQEERGIS